jgi:hypothetical protein
MAAKQAIASDTLPGSKGEDVFFFFFILVSIVKLLLIVKLYDVMHDR